MFGVLGSIWIEAAPNSLQNLPLIFAKKQLESITIVPKYGPPSLAEFISSGDFNPKVTASAISSNGSVYGSLYPGLIKPTEVPLTTFDEYLKSFSATVWLVKPDLSVAKKWTTDTYSQRIDFNFDYPGEISDVSWYGGKKIYKLAFKLNAVINATKLDQSENIIPSYRTITSMFMYNVAADNPVPAFTINTFKNKLLDGTCVSLDCNQVQAFCDSLPDC
jgi:hypothetical protein